MKLIQLRLFIIGCLLFIISGSLYGQGNFTGINNTVINLPCTQSCVDLNFQIPHLKSDEDYQVSRIPYTPYPYTTPTGNELTALYVDDLYSQAISLPFPLCFYGSVYNQVVVGSNGLLTFDIANANCTNAYTISPTIPNNGGSICQLSGVYYPKASIMGAYSDLDPRASASPSNRKIEWRIEGTAPFRRFVASWYRVGVFGNNACGQTTPTTFQIVINEATAAIEVFFEQLICPDGSNSGRTILGVQDFSRTVARAAPGKNAQIWTANNEGYRFVPSGAITRFVSSELYFLGGITPIATATTATTTPGLIDISFPNICIPPPSQQYVVKTTYLSCINPAQTIVIDDTITINRNPSLNATATATNTSCGPPTGSISVIIPPGMGISPYTCILNPGPGQIIQSGPSPITFNNLPLGNYTVVVTDASTNCSSTITNIVVNSNNNLTANITSTQTSCPAASDGNILVTPVNGVAPFTFVLNPGNITQIGLTANFTGLAPGSYTVVVTDASVCSTAPLPINVNAGPILTTTSTKTDALCNGGATGVITVTALTTGTPPYEYSLDGTIWQSSNIFNGLIAGTYTVYYRENNGCQGSHQEIITEPAAITSSVAVTDVICNGQNNGIITITSGGGVAPYTYSIDGGSNWQSSNIFNVAAGSHTVIIRDANNCTNSQTVSASEPAVLSASAANGPASCDGGDDGVINVTAAGGNAGYEYSIDTGTTWQPGNIFNVAPGNYTVTVRDNLGCTTSFPTIVLLGSNFTMTPQTDPTICEGTSTQLQLTSNATQYVWSPVLGLSNTTISNPIANPTVTTEYYVTATLGRCSAIDTVIVNVNPAPIPDAGVDGYICYGQTYQLQASGGNVYNWTPDTYLSNTSISNPITSATKDITYTVSIVSDINGCASLITDQVYVDVTPPIKVKTFPYDTIGYSGDQFQLFVATNDSDVINFSWTPSIGLSDPRVQNPVVTLGNNGDVVQYQVITSTIAGCRGEGYVTVRVYKGPDIYVVTAFSPNGDGRNDRFLPIPVGIKSINFFRVFNRWGQLLFSTNRLHDGWDGTLQGTKQGSGVYVWMIEAITNDNRVISKKGTVTLIR